MDYQKFQTCITACSECAIVCKYCTTSSLDDRDIKLLARCIKLGHDCGAICILAMEAMAGGSEFVQQICELCAEICETCAEECLNNIDLDHCKKCEEVCRICAIECRNVLKNLQVLAE